MSETIEIQALLDKNRASAERSDSNSDQVKLFFKLFLQMYPTNYQSLMPTPAQQKSMQRIYAKQINALSREQILSGFGKVSVLRQQGDKRLDFPDIDKLLGVMTGKLASELGAYPAGMYSINARAAGKLEHQELTDKQKAKSELTKLREMLHD